MRFLIKNLCTFTPSEKTAKFEILLLFVTELNYLNAKNEVRGGVDCDCQICHN